MNLGRDTIPSMRVEVVVVLGSHHPYNDRKQTLSYRLMSSAELGVVAIFDLSLVKPSLWFLVTIWRKSELWNQQFRTTLCHDSPASSLASSPLNPHRLSQNEPLAIS